MMDRRSLVRATALAVPLGMTGLTAGAADLVATAQQEQGFSTFTKAIEAAGLTETLKGEGPYTIFAPTDRAFDQLPEGALDELMKEENQAQLRTLLQFHLVEGEELTADEVTGKEKEVSTLAGHSLSVDGTGQTVLLIAAGQSGARTGVSAQGDMPMSEHQQQVLATSPQQEQQQTAPREGMPSTPHQEQVLSGEAGQQQTATGSAGQSGAQTEVSEQGGMPMSEHQQQVLETDPEGEQQQTTPPEAVPASPHQEQVLAGSAQPGSRASIVQPDIAADNGVFHGIDAVLVPQELQSTFGSMGKQG